MKLLALLSSGIDSAAVCYLMIEKAEIGYMHFAFGEKSIDKAKKIVLKIAGKGTINTMEHTVLIEFVKNVMQEYGISERYTCIYCKLGMLKVAEKIAEKNGYDALLTGDNLGQVASQTIPNLFAEDTAVKIPVLRPLIGMDKENIVEIAKKANTYEISIQSDEGCSAVPKYPVTKAKQEFIKEFSVEPLLPHVKILRV
ncbi:MAG TPA: hypothetical protein EYP30_07995 [Archaeoglobaceae archaeon]|nr:hypothetical protein [Archaeoglobaceae archaeon]